MLEEGQAWYAARRWIYDEQAELNQKLGAWDEDENTRACTLEQDILNFAKEEEKVTMEAGWTFFPVKCSCKGLTSICEMLYADKDEFATHFGCELS